MTALLSNLKSALIDFAFPPGCPACGQPSETEGIFCEACAGLIERLTGPRCQICGALLEHPGPARCPGCARKPPAFERARALALHAGPLADTVRGFKYRRRLPAGAALARYATQNLPSSWLSGFDLLAPVPLHPRRLIRRGFNQALVIFAPAARQADAALAPGLLRRLRHTRPQVGLDPAARRANVTGAFRVSPGKAERLAGARVLILDDVYTTGATADECARVLKAAGAKRVEVLTLVRAAGIEAVARRPTGVLAKDAGKIPAKEPGIC